MTQHWVNYGLFPLMCIATYIDVTVASKKTVARYLLQSESYFHRESVKDII